MGFTYDAWPSTSASKFTIWNRCSYAVNPIIANTNCGYSPREFFRRPVKKRRGKQERQDHHPPFSRPSRLHFLIWSHDLRGLILPLFFYFLKTFFYVGAFRVFKVAVHLDPVGSRTRRSHTPAPNRAIYHPVYPGASRSTISGTVGSLTRTEGVVQGARGAPCWSII